MNFPFNSGRMNWRAGDDRPRIRPAEPGSIRPVTPGGRPQQPGRIEPMRPQPSQPRPGERPTPPRCAPTHAA